jgi:hypothetical protein
MSGDGPIRDLIEQLTQRLEALSPSVKPLAEANKLEGRWSLIYASRGTVRCSLSSPQWPFGTPRSACVSYRDNVTTEGPIAEPLSHADRKPPGGRACGSWGHVAGFSIGGLESHTAALSPTR